MNINELRACSISQTNPYFDPNLYFSFTSGTTVYIEQSIPYPQDGKQVKIPLSTAKPFFILQGRLWPVVIFLIM